MALAVKRIPQIITGLCLTAALLLLFMLGPKALVALKIITISTPDLFLISRVLFWIWLGLVYLYVRKREQLKFFLWKEKPYSIGFYIVSVVGVLLTVFAGAMLIGIIVKSFGFNMQSDKLGLIASLSLPVKILTAVTAAVVEEFIFRGYLQSRLQIFFKGKHWPIIISAVIFGLMHLSYGTLINVLVPVYIGLVFAWYYQKYRNIKVLIICHFLIDLSSLMMMHK